jgi:tRNA(Arg) A34 adenosine deaminase TadA
MSSHEMFIRRANQLAFQATQKGNHPFGALLVHKNKIIAEAENTVNTEDDFTRHAELNLIVEVTKRYSKDILSQATIYASTSPCLMCSYAIWEAGVRNVVYGVSYETKNTFSGRDRFISIEKVFELLDTPLLSVGGILEKECLKTYKHWPQMTCKI